MIRILACSLLIGGAYVQQPPKRDPKVQAVLDQTLAAYKALTGLKLKVSVKAMSEPPSLMPSVPIGMELKLQKPNKIWASNSALRGARKVFMKVISDGSMFWTKESNPPAERKGPLPKKLSDIPQLASMGTEVAIMLLSSDPFASLPTINLQAPQKRDNVDMDVLTAPMNTPGAATGANLTMFIGQKDHLIHGVIYEGAGKDSAGKDFKFKLETVYDLLDPAPKFTASDFAIEPPKPVATKPVMGTTPTKPK